MARILLVGGGCRGRELTRGLLAHGHAVRITTRSDAGREAIEALGAECWVGDPARLATLRGVLDGVAIACWLLAGARGDKQQLLALQTERLEFFLTQAIDSTVRGFIYERGAGDPSGGPREGAWAQAVGAPSASASSPAPPQAKADGALAAGEAVARRMCERNMIPLEVIDGDPRAWLTSASSAVARLLDRA